MRSRMVAGFVTLALSLPALAGSAQGAPRTVVRQLRDTDAALQQQRTQSERLQTRVSELEQQAAANRDALARREREIVQLQGKLDALQGVQGGAPAKPGKPPVRRGRGH